MTKRQTDSGCARHRALSWTDEPLFAPALAILASAVVAISALAIFNPPKNQAVEIVRSVPTVAPELHAVPPVEPAPTVGVIANNGGAAELSSLQLANIPPLAKVDGNLPSAARPVLAQEKAAVTRTYVNAFRHVYANNIMPVSFEMPAEMTPNSFAQAVFNVKLGGIRFLPAPNKPRLFDNSVASATIQLPLPKPSARPPQTGQMGSVAALDAHFERIDYDLANVRNSGNNVPRLYLDKLPADIADVPSVATRKRIFIKSVLPVVLRVNEDILAARQRLQQLRTTLDGGMSLTDEQRDWLYQMAERYETDPYDWDAFMARVDIVPPSLAIAQAAEESGWGTSRFAREGNALFGQYTYKASNGILPEERANGRHHLIRAYSSLVEGVRSYMHNLNYHRAYGEFRSARKWLRAHAKPMDGHTLAGELIRYSERGAAYVETIRHIIRANKLSPLDDARLHEDRWTQHDPAMPGRHS